MKTTDAHTSHLVGTAKRTGHWLLAVGENRLELLLVEAQEERERLVHALLLFLGVAVFGLLAAAAFTGAIAKNPCLGHALDFSPQTLNEPEKP